MQRATRWLAGGAAGVAVAGGAAWAAVVPEWVPVAVLASALGGLAWSRRRDTLPLELSSVAVHRRLAPGPVVQVRARLGRGRVAREVSARVARRDGVELPVLDLGVPAVVGPFTVTAWGEAAEGVEVVVRVREGERTWEARRAYGPELVRAGSFRAPSEGWDAVRDGA